MIGPSHRRVPSLTPDGPASEVRLLAQAPELGGRAAALVQTHGVCQVELGRTGQSAQANHAVARAVLTAFAATTGPARVGFVTAWREPHTVVKEAGPIPQVLLPHHDGGTVTRLEASGLPLADPARRRKAYAAFVVESAGANPDAVTTFYPLPSLVRSVSGCDDVREGLRFYRRTMRNLIATFRSGGKVMRYLTIPMLLGATSPAAIAVDRSEGHSDLDEREVAAAPELESLVGRCPCGGCLGQVARVYCTVLHEVTGLTMLDLGRCFGRSLVAAQGDLILWNNVAFQHSARDGGPGRTLRHGYLTAAFDEGYQWWLDRMWADHWTHPTGELE